MAGTPVAALLLLFSSFGSKVEVLTVAVLVKNVPGAVFESILATIVKKSSPPAGKSGFVQFTVPLLPTPGSVHDQLAGVERETKVMPAGNGSFKVALSAVSGPTLVTSMV